MFSRNLAACDMVFSKVVLHIINWLRSIALWLTTKDLCSFNVFHCRSVAPNYVEILWEMLHMSHRSKAALTCFDLLCSVRIPYSAFPEVCEKTCAVSRRLLCCSQWPHVRDIRLSECLKAFLLNGIEIAELLQHLMPTAYATFSFGVFAFTEISHRYMSKMLIAAVLILLDSYGNFDRNDAYCFKIWRAKSLRLSQYIFIEIRWIHTILWKRSLLKWFVDHKMTTSCYFL